MKCILAAVTSYTNKLGQNKNRMIQIMEKHAGSADLILFGEAWLQGFYSMEFDYGKDRKKAVQIDDPVIAEIKKASADHAIAVSFGFLEKSGDKIYSSQMTISAEGKIIDLYRRVSSGWKESYADEHYAEGHGFHTFEYLNKRILVGTGGDLWFDENLASIRKLSPDVVFWPVYTDFSAEKWNASLKYEYAKQVKEIPADILYVNSVCMDQEGSDIAKGGSAWFFCGEIVREAPSGAETELAVDLTEVFQQKNGEE